MDDVGTHRLPRRALNSGGPGGPVEARGPARSQFSSFSCNRTNYSNKVTLLYDFSIKQF